MNSYKIIYNKRGYLKNYELINGYTLEFNTNIRHALTFKLKMVNGQKCYVTKVDGVEYILTYHPEIGKLVLNEKFIPNNSTESPNNLMFITDDEVLYTNFKIQDLPPYKNMELLSDFNGSKL